MTDLDKLERELDEIQKGRIELWEQICKSAREQISRINGRITRCKDLIREGDPDGYFRSMVKRLERQRAALKRELQDNTKNLAEIKQSIA